MIKRTLRVAVLLAVAAVASACTSTSLSEPTNDQVALAAAQPRLAKDSKTALGSHGTSRRTRSGYLVAAGDR